LVASAAYDASANTRRVCGQDNMANKVKMLEDKLSGRQHDEAAAGVGLPAVAPLPPAAAGPLPYAAAGKLPTDETSFTNSRPPTASTYHGGARPKTGKSTRDDDDEDGARPRSHRPSLDLPYIAE